MVGVGGLATGRAGARGVRRIAAYLWYGGVRALCGAKERAASFKSNGLTFCCAISSQSIIPDALCNPSQFWEIKHFPLLNSASSSQARWARVGAILQCCSMTLRASSPLCYRD